MKKSLVSALTTALVVGAASTTFAASNPFSDIPADHWSYDAVAQLAQDGVVNGYGDNTYRGERNITRYEMAQMVAKAMAKSDVSAKDKALIDKLAAEFSDELNSLGVRVSELEKHADMVKWNGSFWGQYQRQVTENANDAGAQYRLKFRLEPDAEVNEHWHVKARLDADWNPSSDVGVDGNVKLKRAWAEGNYNNFNIKAGKIPEQLSPEMLFDAQLSGASVTYGKDVKFTVEGGRFSNDGQRSNLLSANNKATEFWGFGLGYAPAESKFSGGINYFRLSNNQVGTNLALKDDGTAETKASIWDVAARYNITDTVKFVGEYAQNTNSDQGKKAYTVGLKYKGAKASDPGSWGLSVDYRHLGNRAAFSPTYNTAMANYKGWDINAEYAPAKNVVAYVGYFKGKQILDTDNNGNEDKSSRLWGRLRFFF